MKHGQTIFFCVVTLIGSLSPSIITFVTYLAKGEVINSELFYSQGEFFIYAAALLTSAAYVLFNHKIRTTDVYSILFLISTCLIVFAAIMYTLVSVNSFTNLKFLKISSYSIVIITISIYYYANLISITSTDVVEKDHDNINRIRKGLRNENSN